MLCVTRLGLLAALFLITWSQVSLFVSLHRALPSKEATETVQQQQTAPFSSSRRSRSSKTEKLTKKNGSDKGASLLKTEPKPEAPIAEEPKPKAPIAPLEESLPAAAAAVPTNVSACLLIKDDNELLNEWLAYHYHTLQMRQLIVAVDPTSSESPAEILAKWRRWTDLEIQEWTDNDFMPADLLQRTERFLKNTTAFEPEPGVDPQLAQLSESVQIHRSRQKAFLAQCVQSFQRAGLSLVMHIVSVVSVFLLVGCCISELQAITSIL